MPTVFRVHQPLRYCLTFDLLEQFCLGDTLSAQDIRFLADSRFQVTKFREGYDMVEVDDFIDELISAAQALNPIQLAIMPDLILNKKFQVTKFREGYDMVNVDDFLDGALARFRELAIRADTGEFDANSAPLPTGKPSGGRYVEKNGRIHGSVNSAGAVTRRMTHSNPNLAQVPSSGSPFGPECRELFEASKGFVVVGCDADALELRCLAGYMAAYDNGDYIKTVLEGNKDLGTDMHSVNCRALGMDPKQYYPVDGKQVVGRDIAKTWF